ncbi:TetR/AcrR family transcriptional regulator C-terminal domain-containing protein [Novosphingobium colocasiae]
MVPFFSSKEELFNAVVEDLVAKLENDLRDVLDVDRFSVEALRRLLIRLCARLMTPSAIGLTRLVIGEAGRFPEVGEVFFRNGITTLRARLLRFFEGGFPPARAGVLMELTMCAVQGFRFFLDRAGSGFDQQRDRNLRRLPARKSAHPGRLGRSCCGGRQRLRQRRGRLTGSETPPYPLWQIGLPHLPCP